MLSCRPRSTRRCPDGAAACWRWRTCRDWRAALSRWGLAWPRAGGGLDRRCGCCWPALWPLRWACRGGDNEAGTVLAGGPSHVKADLPGEMKLKRIAAFLYLAARSSRGGWLRRSACGADCGSDTGRPFRGGGGDGAAATGRASRTGSGGRSGYAGRVHRLPVSHSAGVTTT